MFRTIVGAILSIIAVVLTGLTIIFFSFDFLCRTNPNIISSTYRTGELNEYFINNDNFFLSFASVADEKSIPRERQFMFPKITYYHYRNFEEGENLTIEIPPKPCSEVKTLPDLMANKHYTNSTCFDFDSLATKLNMKTVPFFGSFESIENSFFALEMTNCKYDYDSKKYNSCLSQAEIEERSSGLSFFLMRYPKVQLNFQDYSNPMKMNFEEKYFVATSKVRTNEIFRFTNTKLIDDVGWIFATTREFDAITFAGNSSTFTTIEQNSKEEVKTFYYAEFIFSLDEMHSKRIYVKVQQVAANVGGAIKAIMLIANFINRKLATFELNKKVVNELFEQKKMNLEPFDSKIQANTIVTASKFSKNEKNDEEMEIGFFDYYFSFCRKSTVNLSGIKLLIKGKEYISRRLDVIYLLTTYLKFDKLIDMVLTEDQKADIRVKQVIDLK